MKLTRIFSLMAVIAVGLLVTTTNASAQRRPTQSAPPPAPAPVPAPVVSPI